jgi:hypothetical protein
MFARQKLKEALSITPLKLWIPFYYLITFVWILLLIPALPLIFVYRFALSVAAWFAMTRGKDVVVVTNGPGDCGPWLSKLAPLLEGRAIFLNYQERRSWPRSSLPARLFYAFGPQPTPVSFTPRYLPALIVVRRFRAPRGFSFGAFSRDLEPKLEALRYALAARQ